MAIQTYEKGKPVRAAGFVPGPKGKMNAVRDMFSNFREKPAPTSGSNKIPTEGHRYDTHRRPEPNVEQRNEQSKREPIAERKGEGYRRPEPPAPRVDHRIKEDRARETVIPPEDIEMKEVIREQRREPTKRDTTETRKIRQSDFAREVDPFKVVNVILNTKVPLNLSLKKLLAVSPLTFTLVNKGTRVHQC